MRFGDLEGMGTVYDKEGILIPHDDECVLTTMDGYFEKLEKRIRLKWRIEFFDGAGFFVLTDKRLVFLRDPLKYETEFKFSSKRFATMADWEYWVNRSNKASEACAKEFVEVPYSEIEKIKNGKRFSHILVNHQHERYRIVVDSKIGTELEKLQSSGGKVQPLICFEHIESDNERD
jgi:hypothetical protein